MKNVFLKLLTITAVSIAANSALADRAGGGGDLIDDMPVDLYANQGLQSKNYKDLYGYRFTEAKLNKVRNLVPEFAIDLENCAPTKRWVLTSMPLEKGVVTSTTPIPEQKRRRLAEQNKYEVRIDNKILTELIARNSKEIEQRVGVLWFHELVRCVAQENNREDDRVIQILTVSFDGMTSEEEAVSLLHKTGMDGNRGGYITKRSYDANQAIEKERIDLNNLYDENMKLCDELTQKAIADIQKAEVYNLETIKRRFEDQAFQITDANILIRGDLMKLKSKTLDLGTRSSLELDAYTMRRMCRPDESKFTCAYQNRLGKPCL